MPTPNRRDPNRKASPWVLGRLLPGEIDIPSGIGAVNVHWMFGGAQPLRFGRLREQPVPRIHAGDPFPVAPGRRRA